MNWLRRRRQDRVQRERQEWITMLAIALVTADRTGQSTGGLWHALELAVASWEEGQEAGR